MIFRHRSRRLPCTQTSLSAFHLGHFVPPARIAKDPRATKNAGRRRPWARKSGPRCRCKTRARTPCLSAGQQISRPNGRVAAWRWTLLAKAAFPARLSCLLQITVGEIANRGRSRHGTLGLVSSRRRHIVHICLALSLYRNSLSRGEQGSRRLTVSQPATGTALP